MSRFEPLSGNRDKKRCLANQIFARHLCLGAGGGRDAVFYLTLTDCLKESPGFVQQALNVP